jgi:signal transduction histidine kinase
VFGGMAAIWFMPLEDCLSEVSRASEGIRSYGDATFASYVDCVYLPMRFEIASSLDSCEIEANAALAFAGHTSNRHSRCNCLFERQLIRALRGLTVSPGSFDDDEFDSAVLLQELGRLPFIALVHHVRRALSAAIFNDMPTVFAHSSEAVAAGGYPAYFLEFHIHLFHSLGLAWRLRGTPGEASAERQSMLAELEDMRCWIAERAADQPGNWLHLLHLVDAEQAWTQGHLWRATHSFDAAMARVLGRGRAWQQALIIERAARFHLQHANAAVGRRLMAECHGCYLAWGAVGKVRALEREYDWVKAPWPLVRGLAAPPGKDSKAVSLQTLDLLGLLRASQALSSETNIERLTARVGETLAEMTGATRVHVLSWHEAQWWLLLPVAEAPVLKLAEAGAGGLLPVSAVTYTDRTWKALVVEDACKDDRFARDPYFAAQACCSLLAIPIAGPSGTRAMVLLENNLGRAAFSVQRQEAVMLIAGQLAVSLANAQLYQGLESRVRERTRELQEAQTQLVATARRAGMAEIANNVLHSVGNVLNSVNVSARVVRRAISDSTMQGLTVAADLLNEHANDLAEFTRNDERGRVLLPYLHKVAHLGVQERQGVLEELESLVRSVDHIKEIIATQQSHAGASSVLQTVDVHEMLEEAVRLSSDLIAGEGIRLVREFEPTPLMPLDRRRILQVLLNLIANASHAMEGTAPEARTLTLRTSMEASGKCLRIAVRDEGEGIPADNLTRIFSHGFTTRKTGHGFGLHGSAVSALEMGGKLVVHSDGPGRGALFTLEVPVAPVEPVQ